MRTNYIDGVVIKYQEQDARAAELIANACRRTSEINGEHWGLNAPKNCQVYVMHSWQWYLWNAAPGAWKAMLVLTLPFWYFRVKKIWPIAGGWEQQFGNRHTIGVKPPAILGKSDRSLGSQIFEQDESIEQKVEHITCHELTHAFASSLKLPHWLKEGLSMVTVDLFAGMQTVKPGTLESLKDYSGTGSPERARRINIDDPGAMIYLYTRGYWITRFLDEVQPETLRTVLRERMSQTELENLIADSFEMNPADFWSRIDDMVIEHYSD